MTIILKTGSAVLAGAALLLASGCGSKAAANAALGATPTAPASPTAPTSAGGPRDTDSPLPTFPPITSSARPVVLADDEKGCAAKASPDTYTIRATGVEGGTDGYALVGYQQLMTCGPGIPDDVDYADAESELTVRLEPNAKVTLIGALPDDEYTADVRTLVSMVHNALASPGPGYTDDALAWYGGRFEVSVDAAGEISRIAELYHP